uniref:Uncharacterized protein n=1 Tax=Panagrolaimus davidi TaxID=227884 RepID=A0A914PS54_9BILA
MLSDPSLLARLTRLPAHMQAQFPQPQHPHAHPYQHQSQQHQPNQELTGSGGSSSGGELDKSTVTVLHLPNGVP